MYKIYAEFYHGYKRSVSAKAYLKRYLKRLVRTFHRLCGVGIGEEGPWQIANIVRIQGGAL